VSGKHRFNIFDRDDAWRCMHKGCTIRIANEGKAWQPKKGRYWRQTSAEPIPSCKGVAPVHEAGAPRRSCAAALGATRSLSLILMCPKQAEAGSKYCEDHRDWATKITPSPLARVREALERLVSGGQTRVDRSKGTKALTDVGALERVLPDAMQALHEKAHAKQTRWDSCSKCTALLEGQR
jgi:hypothetical protein